jgi:hypothetical protein
VDGITFGLEVCLDHGNSKLANYYASDAPRGEPKVQVQLIPSWGMSIDEASLLNQPGILVFNVDGPRGSSAGISEPGKYYCPEHLPDLHTSAGKCPKTDFYICPTCKICPMPAFSACTHCGVEVAPIYYCGKVHLIDPPVANCPICGKATTPMHGCRTCKKTNPGPKTCPGHGPMVPMSSCNDAHVQDGPDCAHCHTPLQPYSRCWKHGPASASQVPCPECGTPMVTGHYDLLPYKPATKGASAAVPDPPPNQQIPAIDPNRASATVKTVTAKQSVLFERPGRIQVYDVMDVAEAEIV